MELNAYKMKQMCLRKKKYKTYEYACKVAKIMSEKYNKEQRVYWCPICMNYHLTSQI